MKIFITGATGFIGNAPVKKLTGSGHEVCCLVRLTSRIEASCEAGFHLVTGNVNDPESLHLGIEGCDWVIHLANLYPCGILSRFSLGGSILRVRIMSCRLPCRPVSAR